jgi:hypothetical protein
MIAKNVKEIESISIGITNNGPESDIYMDNICFRKDLTLKVNTVTSIG